MEFRHRQDYLYKFDFYRHINSTFFPEVLHFDLAEEKKLYYVT